MQEGSKHKQDSQDKDGVARLKNLTARIDKAEAEQNRGIDTGAELGRVVGNVGMLRVGSDFASIVLGATGAGWLLDYVLKTAPWFMLVMLLVGFCSGVVNIWRVLQKSDSEPRMKEEEERHDGDAFPH